MSWVAIGGAAVGLIGAGVQADAAGDAADTQANATKDANGRTIAAARQVRTDLSDFRTNGAAASNRLAYLLGTGDPAMEAKLKAVRPDEVTLAYREILGRNPDAGGLAYYRNQLEQGVSLDQIRSSIAGSQENQQAHGTYTQDPAELAAIAAAEAEAAQPKTGDYGALMRNFTGEDLQNEPGYQFGLNEGTKTLQGGIAARGGLFSGAAGKALTRYGNDYASTKFGEAFNRDSANKTRMYNFLSGSAGMGQNAAAQTGNAGQTMAQQVGANTTAMGTAQGAAGIAQANAWNGALSNGFNAYQNNELMKKLQAPSSTSYGSGWGTGSSYGNQDYGQYL